MKSFKTPKGTELPILDMRGKPYLQVAHRLVWMREEHPDWGITTEIVHHDEKRSVMRARILDGTGRVLAEATKQENAQGFADHIEKAETGSIGRALAMCGYGTQFCSDDFDEGERLADAPIPFSKPTAVPQITTSAPTPFDEEGARFKIDFGKFNGKWMDEVPNKDLDNYASWLKNDAKTKGKPISPHAQRFIDAVAQRLMSQ